MNRDSTPRRVALALIASLVLGSCASHLNRPPVGLYSSGAAAEGSHPPTTGDDLFADVPKSELTLLERGEDGFLARLALIETSRESIDAQYYLWSREGTGLVLANRLLAAAHRGVKVRLLVDDYLIEPEDVHLAALQGHENVDFRLYNPSAFSKNRRLAKAFDWIFRFGELDHRMHNKLFVADRKTAIMGGRNVADDYFGASEDMNFRDFDVVFRGPAVPTATDSFEEYWNSDRSKPVSSRFHEKLTPAELNVFNRGIEDRVAALDADPDFSLPVSLSPAEAGRFLRDVASRSVSAPTLVVADHPEKSGLFSKGSLIGPAFINLEIHADESLLLVNPYFVPYAWEVEGLGNFIDRGGEIHFLTNSMVSNNQASVHAKYAKMRPHVLAAGVHLHEIRPDAMRRHHYFSTPGAEESILALHGKAAVFDDDRVYIGTFNFDPRSAALNTEMGLLIESKPFAKQLRNAVEPDLHPVNSWKPRRTGSRNIHWEGVDHDGTPLLLQREPGTTPGQRFKKWLIGLLPVRREV